MLYVTTRFLTNIVYHWIVRWLMDDDVEKKWTEAILLDFIYVY
jgi:hypothetical protein